MSTVPRPALVPQPGQGGRVQLSTGHSSHCPGALCDASLYPSLYPTGEPNPTGVTAKAPSLLRQWEGRQSTDVVGWQPVPVLPVPPAAR